jgi:diguanylate cyclase (GGDEF)-like protein
LARLSHSYKTQGHAAKEKAMNNQNTSSTLNNEQPALIGSPDLNQRTWDLTADDQWHRHGETLILLHHANAMVRQAEQRLAEQEKKIQELESLASTDPLTGLMNRRGFENFFTQELERTRRHNTFGSVLLLIDLDKFKEINDVYGHQAGDACLKKVAECLLKNIRCVDAAARIGGDEFAVLLSHTDPEKSANCVHQIKRAINSLHADWQGIPLQISASVGIKHVSDTGSFETAYHAADKALYNDKKNRKIAGITEIAVGEIVNLG